MSNVYLTFQGTGFETGFTQQFDVLTGDNPPSIVGGYGKWRMVTRPLRRGLTIFESYEPVQMAVEVRFGPWQWSSSGSWDQSDKLGKMVETDIGKLEWMAGSNFHEGNTPVVYVNSYSDTGKIAQSDLIPPQYHNFHWVVNGLQWGKSWRNVNGFRIWQDATITLLEYLNVDKPAPKQSTALNGGYFIAKAGADTALLIASAKSSRSPVAYHEILANRIISDPKNDSLKLRSIRQKIRSGQRVWVPRHDI